MPQLADDDPRNWQYSDSGLLEPLLCGRRGVHRAKLVSENTFSQRSGLDALKSSTRCEALIHVLSGLVER